MEIRFCLSLGPSVVENFVDSRYRYNYGYDESMPKLASVVDVSIPIESLNHRLAENVYPMVRRLPMEG